MKCREFEQLLDTYIDGGLEGSVKLEFETHMVSCGSCGHLYAITDAVGEIISKPAPGEPRISLHFADNLVREMESRKRGKLYFRRLIAGLAAAACVGLVLTGIVVSEMGQSRAPNHPTVASRDTHLVAVETPEAEVVQTPEVVEAKAEKKTIDEKIAHEELNDWLADKLEDAGTTLWELAQMRSMAWDQMRHSVLKDLNIPIPSATGTITPANPHSLDKETGIIPVEQDKTPIEPGIELI